jgi:hypothetical protein
MSGAKGRARAKPHRRHVGAMAYQADGGGARSLPERGALKVVLVAIE